MKKENKDQLLKSILTGTIEKTSIEGLLRNNLLTKLINENPSKKDFYKNKYLSNSLIRENLLSIHNDILNSNKSRQTFGPGTFTGFQGQLNCIILTKNVIENKLKWNLSETVHNINYDILYKYKLRCSKTCFNHIYDLIMTCYPEANLKPYYFRKAAHVWYDENKKMKEGLVRYAIKEFVMILTNPKGKYKLNFKNLPRWINYKLFREPVLPYNTNLSYMLSYCFGNSHIKAIMFAYPELNLKPYYFSNVPNNYWSGKQGLENAKEVMNELMDILTNPKGDYKLSREEVREIFKFKTYSKPILPYKKNMRGMLQTLFNNSPSAPFDLLEK